MKHATTVVLVLAALLAVTPASAQDTGIQNVAFFYPLRTRRPVIERELEFRVEHAKARDGRTTEAAGALELPILPRWQVELEVPLIFTDPRDGTAQGGAGDLRLENKVMVWQSLDWLAQVAVASRGACRPARSGAGSAAKLRWSRSSPAASPSATSICSAPWRTSST